MALRPRMVAPAHVQHHVVEPRRWCTSGCGALPHTDALLRHCGSSQEQASAFRRPYAIGSSALAALLLCRPRSSNSSSSSSTHGSSRVRRNERQTGNLQSSRRDAESPSSALPLDLQGSARARELNACVAAMRESLDLSLWCNALMRKLQPVVSRGLYGYALEQSYVKDGTTVAEVCITVLVCHRLLERFPNDPILTNLSDTWLEANAEFVEEAAEKLQQFWKDLARVASEEPRRVVRSTAASALSRRYRGPENSEEADEDADESPSDTKTNDIIDKVLTSLRTSNMSLKDQAKGELPERYWILNPLDTEMDFRNEKIFCISLALMEGGRPVVSAVISPRACFHHARCRAPNTNMRPLLFAVQGGGAYQQMLGIFRSSGYGHTLATRTHSMTAGRSSDSASAALLNPWQLSPADEEELQIRITMQRGLRQDIVDDVESLCAKVGLKDPKLQQLDHAMRFCNVAMGLADVAVDVGNGLFDASSINMLAADIAAPALIAEESGASVTDIRGEPLQWSGAKLDSNHGCLVLGKRRGLPSLSSWIEACKASAQRSEAAYKKRKKERARTADTLQAIAKAMDQDTTIEWFERKRVHKLLRHKPSTKLLGEEPETSKWTL